MSEGQAGLPRSMAGRIEGNEMRADLEEIGRRVGHRFAVNTVVNSRRELVALFAGDPIEAHRAGVRFARTVCGTVSVFPNAALQIPEEIANLAD